MTEGKIQFELGSLKFCGEGSETWVTRQLNWLFEKLGELKKDGLLEASVAPQQPAPPAASSKVTPVGSLASHIKAKGGDSSQLTRFLATADWLRQKGEQNLKAAMVIKALGDNHQKRLANAADCLNKNVNKGFCEKTSDGFFITPEGLKALGYSD